MTFIFRTIFFHFSLLADGYCCVRLQANCTSIVICFDCRLYWYKIEHSQRAHDACVWCFRRNENCNRKWFESQDSDKKNIIYCRCASNFALCLVSFGTAAAPASAIDSTYWRRNRRRETLSKAMNLFCGLWFHRFHCKRKISVLDADGRWKRRLRRGNRTQLNWWKWDWIHQHSAPHRMEFANGLLSMAKVYIFTPAAHLCCKPPIFPSCQTVASSFSIVCCSSIISLMSIAFNTHLKQN